jgi:hypothetical protein
MLPFLLPSLCLQLLFHVLDVPSKAVAMKVVVAGCFCKSLLFLETIEADDTLAMGDVVICENFLPFLDEFIEHGSTQPCLGHMAQCL